MWLEEQDGKEDGRNILLACFHKFTYFLHNQHTMITCFTRMKVMGKNLLILSAFLTD